MGAGDPMGWAGWGGGGLGTSVGSPYGHLRDVGFFAQAREGRHFVHVRHGGLYVGATTTADTSPFVLVEFLNRSGRGGLWGSRGGYGGRGGKRGLMGWEEGVYEGGLMGGKEVL